MFVRPNTSMFPGLQHVPGVGYVQAGPSAFAGGGAQLGGEADVMMISGLGALGAGETSSSSQGIDTTTPALRFVNSIPWWGWALVGAAALVIAGVAFGYVKLDKRD